jgi:sugar phosphate isomerase/epimerase
MPVAIQLYSVREDLEKDFFGVLEKVKAMGYNGVEFAGYYGNSASAVRQKMEKLGLKAVASHIALKAFEEDLEGVLAFHKELGVKYLVVPYLEEALRPGAPGWPEALKTIRSLGQASHRAGFQLLYHNHDFEFVKIGREYGLDVLFQEIPLPYLATEIDTCWVSLVGVDPIAYLKKYAGRAPVFHLKDFVATKVQTEKPFSASTDKTARDGTSALVDRNSFDFRPLGEGKQDVQGLLKAAEESGVEWIIVEQDLSSDRPALEAMAVSRKYLAGLGY